MLIEIAILIFALACLVWAAGTFLKNLGIKVERKPAPLSEEEREAIKAATEFNKAQTNILNGMGGGIYG